MPAHYFRRLTGKNRSAWADRQPGFSLKIVLLIDDLRGKSTGLTADTAVAHQQTDRCWMHIL